VKRPPVAARRSPKQPAVREEQGAVRRPSPGVSDGIGRMLALARRLGNQALERVLGDGRDGGARRVADARNPDEMSIARVSGAMGADLSGVRVMDDAASHTAADALGATALTIGDTVLLGRDAPAASTPAREHLLAHELAHVAQQRTAAAVTDAVSTPGDAHERAADAAATHAVRGESASPEAAGAPPAVQLQKKSGERAGLDRAAAQQRLEAYFTRVLEQQGGKSVSMTEDVKGTLRRIFLNDMPGLLKFDTFLSRTAFPGSPTELAAAVAQYLPDPIDPARLAHLEIPGAESTKAGRVKDVIKRTEPYVSPETQRQQQEFDRQAKEARRNDKTVVGPFSVDLNRILNIGKRLPKALEKPKHRPKQGGAPNAALDAAIASIDKDALTPAEARGGPKANEFADPELVARAIAADLDRAQAGKERSIMLRLDAIYAGVKDRDAIIAEVARIARLVRDALPHRASEVQAIDLYFGDKMVRRISLAGTLEKTEGSQ
jgi:hypothetical protein